MNLLFIVLIILVLFFVIVLIANYNKFVKLNNEVSESFADIDVFLKKRIDLIPNLVEVCKGYMKHENSVLTDITSLRNKSYSGMSLDKKIEHNRDITNKINNLLAVSENYPELKASENFLAFHNALVKIEEDIEMARRYYNGTTRNYNMLIEQFPTNILAKLFGFEKRSFFEVDLLTREQVQITFEDRRKNPR